MTEQEIKAGLFSFLTANENLLSAFLVCCQAVEHEADPKNKMDLEKADAQAKEIMDYLEKGGEGE